MEIVTACNSRASIAFHTAIGNALQQLSLHSMITDAFHTISTERENVLIFLVFVSFRFLKIPIALKNLQLAGYVSFKSYLALASHCIGTHPSSSALVHLRIDPA